MQHASIATFYDAGLSDLGEPYFVMEYVRRYSACVCRKHRLPLRARIVLVEKICTQYTTRNKGRDPQDLKPSNILVTTIDEQVVPK